MDPNYRFLDPPAAPTTLVDLLRQRAECQADDRAYTFLVDGESEEVHLTYGELDRRRMAERVFADPAERARLEAIVHPAVRAFSRQELERLIAERGRAPLA